MLSDESDDEGEDDPLCPTIRVPNVEKLRVRRKWEKSLILRTLGKVFSYAFLSRRIQQLWARKGRVSIWDIGFGHFVARFDEVEDYNRAFLEGPWLVGDHYVVSEEWRPNFEPGYSQVNTIRAWVRLPGLPLENFDVGVLKLIGDRIGKTVRVDGTTLFGSRGNYARMCVEIDLHKPLVSKYRLRRRVRRIEYEGLHEICFTCGRYGHGKDSCSLNTEDKETTPIESTFSNPLFHEEKERPELEEDFGPWMLAKKNVRRRNTPNHRKNEPTAKVHDPKQNGDGSRFKVLVESDEEEEEELPQPQHEEERVIPQTHASETMQPIEKSTPTNTKKQIAFHSGEASEHTNATKRGGPEKEAEVIHVASVEGEKLRKNQTPVMTKLIKEQPRRSADSTKTMGDVGPAPNHIGVTEETQIPRGQASKAKEVRGTNPKSKQLGTGLKPGKSKESNRVDLDNSSGGGSSQ
ncbi:hypothetical protein LINPERHAP2_LOCUS17510 [Linum perenne]